MKKLVEEKSWIQVLKKKTYIVTKIFRVIMHTIYIDFINMKEKKVIIK